MSGLPGPYRVPHYRAEVTCVVTNKTPAGTYRAPGRFEATFVRERIVDMAARALSIDPAEVRRRNFIPPEAMPYDLGTSTHGSAVVHDEQSALTRGRVARLGSFLAKAVSPAPPPLRSFRQVDSRDDPRIQVADLLAGIARRRTPSRGRQAKRQWLPG